MYFLQYLLNLFNDVVHHQGIFFQKNRNQKMHDQSAVDKKKKV